MVVKVIDNGESNSAGVGGEFKDVMEVNNGDRRYQDDKGGGP